MFVAISFHKFAAARHTLHCFDEELYKCIYLQTFSVNPPAIWSMFGPQQQEMKRNSDQEDKLKQFCGTVHSFG